MRLRLPHVALALFTALLAPTVASADTVVPDNQIVQGLQCVGIPCANGEAMGGPGLWMKSADTPAVRLLQTNTGGFTAQTWDVGGNETNFFVRDLTSGSRLPFRIRPGAPTSSLEITAGGEVNTSGVVQQDVSSTTPAGAFDGAAALAALRTLSIDRYTNAAAPHVAPGGAAFRAAFGLGAQDTRLAPQDVAAVALAAVKALDARVSTLSLTPGPKGDTGAKGGAGAAGATGPAGAPGAPGAASPTADLSAATQRIAALEASNAKLTRSLATLQRQMAKLTRKKTKATKKGNGR